MWNIRIIDTLRKMGNNGELWKIERGHSKMGEKMKWQNFDFRRLGVWNVEQ